MSRRSQPGGRPPADATRIAYRTFRPGDAEGVVDVLNAAYRVPWGDMEHWLGKRGGHPDFQPEEIFVAECDGRIVGCLHTDLRPVKLGGGVSVLMSMDGDLAVHPDFRGYGVPEELYRRSSEIYRQRGVVVRGGFANELLWTRFYKPRIGYVCGFDKTRGFAKWLTSSRLSQRLFGAAGAGGEAARAEGSFPVIELRLRDTEPVFIGLLDSGPVPVAPAHDGALVVEVDQRALNLARGSLWQRIGLVARWALTGRLRLRRALTAGPGVARWLLRHRSLGAGKPG